MTVALLFQNNNIKREIMVQNLYLCSLIAPLFFSQQLFRNQPIGTQKQLFSKFRQPVWAVRNAVTFSKGILQHDNHIFIFSPVHGLLKSAIKLEVRAILSAWRIV